MKLSAFWGMKETYKLRDIIMRRNKVDGLPMQHVTFDIPVKQQKRCRFLPKEIKMLQRGTNKDYIYNGSFNEAISPVLVGAQLLGIMPVCGVRNNDLNCMEFKWKSFRTIYSLIILFGLIFMTVLTYYSTFSHKIEFNKIVPIIFYTSNLVAFIYFIFLAKKWPEIMRRWEQIDKTLPPMTTFYEKAALAHKIKIISIVVISLSMVEHLLSIVSSVHNANNCRTIKDPLKAFFAGHLSQLFYWTNYTPLKAFLGKIINIVASFMWNYMDLFVILVSLGLASRFRLINDYLIKFKGQVLPEAFWSQQRINYRNLCELVDNIDNAMAMITMLSFSNNLFFICVQLLNSLNPMPSFAHAFYFWFSLIYLIFRTLAVSLYSADINDEAKRPIETLRAVPRESWCLEVKRFAEEVTNDIVALSGMKFFYITRKLVLSVAGTIITYELVLIQFHQENTNIDVCGP